MGNSRIISLITKIMRLTHLEIIQHSLMVISTTPKYMELHSNNTTRANICISSRIVLFKVIKLLMDLLQIFSSQTQIKNIRTIIIMALPLDMHLMEAKFQYSIITNSVMTLLQGDQISMIYKLPDQKSIFKNRLELVLKEAVN